MYLDYTEGRGEIVKISRNSNDIVAEVAGVADLLYSVQREAIEKGWKEGLQKGLQQGREEEKRDIAKRMLQRGVSVSVVAEFTGLTESEVEEVMRSLDR